MRVRLMFLIDFMDLISCFPFMCLLYTQQFSSSYFFGFSTNTFSSKKLLGKGDKTSTLHFTFSLSFSFLEDLTQDYMYFHLVSNDGDKTDKSCGGLSRGKFEDRLSYGKPLFDWCNNGVTELQFECCQK